MENGNIMTAANDDARRPRVAVVHPRLIVGGGSEACALWILEALKNDYHVTLMTSNAVDLSEFNAFYHTDLKAGDVSLVRISPPKFLDSPKVFAALRACRLARFCKENGALYDVMISAYNQMDFGRSGIQYILDPNYNQEMLSLLNPSPRWWKKWFYLDSVIRILYMRLSSRLAGYTDEGMKKNLTLVDSDWTGRLVRQHFGLATTTLYPPVFDQFPEIRWEKREMGFVCMGRIVPDKRIETIIRILSAVRGKVGGLHLHIVGKAGDKGYARRLKALVRREEDWIFWEEGVTAEKKRQLLINHRFGIHGKTNEPFGIAPAEMVQAGAIVWVPEGGGQTEIVAHERLTYSDEGDAVEKISGVIRDPSLQSMLRGHLREQARRFSLNSFLDSIRAFTARCLEENAKRSA
jgi:glycosyltransferase involved in cell wall biosynthesis